jgi:lipopolysaccharide/colanic/teichoic acid biosynthesis glycosyltransferase
MIMTNPEQIEVQRNSLRADFPMTGVTSSPIRNQIRPEDRANRWHLGQIHATQAFRARRPNPILFGDGAARYHILKRSFDIALCVVVLPFALPILAACALAVRLSSPGPVLFIQQRTGRGGRPFGMLKIRTMVVDAEHQKAALKEQDTVLGPDFKPTDDPRVTRAGAFFRKTSLDELPQLWNVLKGEMSLVGPRPTSFGVDNYERWHTERLEVQPGVTGLWQIMLRGDTNFNDRVRLDIAYVRTRSFALDLSILLRTLPSVLLRRGAF